MSDYNQILTNLKKNPAKVLSDDRMRATSMVKDEIYGMKAFIPGKPETYYLVKFNGCGTVSANGTVKQVSETIKLNNMDSTDRYFVGVWDSEKEEFVDFQAFYENKFLNIDLPEIGKKFVTFRRIKEEYYDADSSNYNNTLTAKKNSEDLFWEKHRKDWAERYPTNKKTRIIFSIEAGNQERFDEILKWRSDDYISIDENNFIINYPFRILDNKYDTKDMIKKFKTLGFSWDEVVKFLNLTNEKHLWERHFS